MTLNESRDALATIESLTANDDHAQFTFRMLMTDPDMPISDMPADLRPANATIADLRRALKTIIADPYSRDELTDLALADSLCPLHFIDYAACFDDDDDECAQIRTIHPSHDT